MDSIGVAGSQVSRIAIHVIFACGLATMRQFLVTPSLSSFAQLLGIVLDYAMHAAIQSGLLKIKAIAQFRLLQSYGVFFYAAYIYAVVNEMEYERFCAMEKLAGVHMSMQSVVFIDMKVTVPSYIFSAAVMTFTRWHWMGFSNVTPESLAQHLVVAGMMACLVSAMQSQIAAKLESDDASSLLLASRRVLKGVCDGDLVLDRRNHLIVEDASSLERLLHAKTKLSGRNFLDLFLDVDGRQRFLHFLQSEAAPKVSNAAIPPCLRIALQGADGPVSTDVFCTSCAAAGQDCSWPVVWNMDFC